MMRMVCDTNYILDPESRACPKLDELEKILDECRESPEVKILIFSEWERMLQLARGLCEKMRFGFAWHTGSVPQRKRHAEILLFKNDPKCRVFLSTDSGSTGLNLQNASVVINCDLPWNPARLEQRLTEPSELKERILPPAALAWGTTLPVIRDFILEPSACWKKTAETVERLLAD